MEPLRYSAWVPVSFGAHAFIVVRYVINTNLITALAWFEGGTHFTQWGPYSNSKMRNKIGTWVPILPVICGPGSPNVRDPQNFMTLGQAN